MHVKQLKEALKGAPDDSVVGFIRFDDYDCRWRSHAVESVEVGRVEGQPRGYVLLAAKAKR